MALTKSKFTQFASQAFRSFLDAIDSDVHIPAVAIVDASGDQLSSLSPGITLTNVVHPAAVSVGAATTPVIAANTSRQYLLIVNDSDEVIYIALGTSAILNRGIRINPNGGSYEISAGNNNLFTGAVNAICASGSKNLIVTEGE